MTNFPQIYMNDRSVWPSTNKEFYSRDNNGFSSLGEKSHKEKPNYDIIISSK